MGYRDRKTGLLVLEEQDVDVAARYAQAVIAACERGANRRAADAAPLPGECQPEAQAELASRSQPAKAGRP